jgi:two-component system, LytTR family, sensor kinase
MHIFISLLKDIAILLGIAYLFSKTPVFNLLLLKDLRLRDFLTLYIFFSVMSIIGTYTGVPINDAIANNRVIGAAIAGLMGGPTLGFAVGFTAGMHRFFLGGFTAVSCGFSTMVEGLMAGYVHQYFTDRGRYERVFDLDVAFLTTLVAEFLQMIIIIMISRPVNDAIELVKIIALPMIISNSLGTTLIMSLFRDQRNNYDRIGSSSSKQALKIAQRILGELSKGLNKESAEKIASIILEETSVAAVAITDRENVLAFVGIGNDHHKSGLPIASQPTRVSIEDNKIIFIDGTNERFNCPISNDCKLTSVLVAPINIKDEVIGTIKLYGQKNKLFFKINEALGKGIAELVSNQLLAARYENQKNLLTAAELNLLQAQINPHFLFNALTTIISVNRRNPEIAIGLLIHLSNFFRKILIRNKVLSTIEEELEHVNSYIEIEKVRLEGHLQINTQIDGNLLDVKIPTFTLQPLVENAVKHGISNLLEQGKIEIRVFRNDGHIQIDIEDNGGTYDELKDERGVGIQIVDKRIKNLAGNEYGINIHSIPDVKTTASILLPAGGII